jgi:hypothetical protein
VSVDTRAHMTRPCENCPYRKDAPLKLWHPNEFLRVLLNENPRNGVGTVFACHKQAELPPAKRGFCAGWALDQKKRDFPSIAMRLALNRLPNPQAYIDSLNAKGLKLFRTVYSMCRANGVAFPAPAPDPHIRRPTRRKRANP